MKLSYRKLHAADSKSYRAIRLESLRLHPESFGASFETQRKLPKLMFEKALKLPSDDRFVVGAFDERLLIGICAFILLASDSEYQLKQTGAIIQMYVKSTYRGRKIGLGLVQVTLREAFQRPDIDQVILEVYRENIGAIRVYEQAGFQIYNPEAGSMNIGKNSRVMIIQRND